MIPKRRPTINVQPTRPGSRYIRQRYSERLFIDRISFRVHVPCIFVDRRIIFPIADDFGFLINNRLPYTVGQLATYACIEIAYAGTPRDTVVVSHTSRRHNIEGIRKFFRLRLFDGPYGKLCVKTSRKSATAENNTKNMFGLENTFTVFVFKLL